MLNLKFNVGIFLKDENVIHSFDFNVQDIRLKSNQIYNL